MKLFTSAIDKKLFAQYSKGSDLQNQKVVAKIFNPYGRGVWYLLNSDPDDPDYIWAIVKIWDVELGSVSRSQLENMKIPPYNLKLERDLSFDEKNALEVFEGLQNGEMYGHGGGVENENAEMVLNNNKQIAHHTEELSNAVKSNTEVPAWVVAKVNRSASDLSDATHYMEGMSEKMMAGGVVKTIEKGQEYRYKPNNSIEKDILSKVDYTINNTKFAGNFKIKEHKEDTYFYFLDEFDRNLVKDIPLKPYERIYRYISRSSAIGGYSPLVKINLDKNLIYFANIGEFGDESISFQTQGLKPQYINYVQADDEDYYKEGGNIEEIEILSAKQVSELVDTFNNAVFKGVGGLHQNRKYFEIQASRFASEGIKTALPKGYELINVGGDLYWIIQPSAIGKRLKRMDNGGTADLNDLNIPVIRTQFEEEDFEFAKGGGVESIYVIKVNGKFGNYIIEDKHGFSEIKKEYKRQATKYDTLQKAQDGLVRLKKQWNDKDYVIERVTNSFFKKYAKGGGVDILPAQGTLLSKDKKIKLDYKKVGDNYEFVVYEGETNPVENYSKTSFNKKDKNVKTMNHNQFINYIYAEGYIDDKNMATGGGVGDKINAPKGKVKVKEITIHWAEGDNSRYDKFPKTYTTWEDSNNAILPVYSDIVKENVEGTYNKVKFTVKFEDGEEYEGRLDVSEKEDNPMKTHNVIGKHIKEFLDYQLSEKSRTTEDKKKEVREWLEKYDLGLEKIKAPVKKGMKPMETKETTKVSKSYDYISKKDIEEIKAKQGTIENKDILDGAYVKKGWKHKRK